MANDLKILLVGTLNQTASITEINRALSQIEKKINKIKINVEVGQQAQTQLNNLNQQIRNLGSRGNASGTQAISTQFSNIGHAAHQASGHVQTFGGMLKQAFEKFPINRIRWE
jgi:hypothetical protein